MNKEEFKAKTNQLIDDVDAKIQEAINAAKKWCCMVHKILVIVESQSVSSEVPEVPNRMVEAEYLCHVFNCLAAIQHVLSTWMIRDAVLKYFGTYTIDSHMKLI